MIDHRKTKKNKKIPIQQLDFSSSLVHRAFLVMNNTAANPQVPVALKKALEAFVIRYPLLASRLMKLHLREDNEQSTGYVSISNILGFNREYIEGQDVDQNMRFLAHEISHILFNHHIRGDKALYKSNWDLWNMACDYVVNDFIARLGFKIPENRYHDPSRFTCEMSAEEVFRVLLKEREEKEKKEEEKKGKNQQAQENGDKKEAESENEERGDNNEENNKDSEENDANGQDESGGDEEEGKEGESEQSDKSPESGKNIGENGDEDDVQNSENESLNQSPEIGNEEGKRGEGEIEHPDKTRERIRAQGGENDKEEEGEGEAETETTEEQALIDTRQALQIAQSCGLIHANAKRLLGTFTTRTPIDFEDILNRFFQEITKSDYSYRRINKRLSSATDFIFPALYSRAFGRVLFAIDTSGSVSGDEVRNMVGDILNCVDTYISKGCQAPELGVIQFDSEVAGFETVSQATDIQEFEAKGGGGTDYQPVFKWIEENTANGLLIDQMTGAAPEALIILTDGFCDSFPEEIPDFPVFWVIVGRSSFYGSFVPPFGEVIQITNELLGG